ncbi:MAG: hypothetical protein HWE27_16105 [Gammaproteobacteria bacterium]|nr:hypothetical protein [Gammaproteobacteria bacterium]
MFLHLPVSTMREILMHPVSSYIVDWYKKQYPHDDIDFVSDTFDDWPFETGSREDLANYEEITDELLDTLVEQGVIIDNGFEWQDKDEPDTVFIRDLALATKME